MNDETPDSSPTSRNNGEKHSSNPVSRSKSQPALQKQEESSKENNKQTSRSVRISNSAPETRHVSLKNDELQASNPVSTVQEARRSSKSSLHKTKPKTRKESVIISYGFKIRKSVSVPNPSIASLDVKNEEEERQNRRRMRQSSLYHLGKFMPPEKLAKRLKKEEKKREALRQVAFMKKLARERKRELRDKNELLTEDEMMEKLQVQMATPSIISRHSSKKKLNSKYKLSDFDYVDKPLQMPKKGKKPWCGVLIGRAICKVLTIKLFKPFRPKIENTTNETDQPWMYLPRTNKGEHYVENIFHLYCRKVIRPSHAETRLHYVTTLQICLQAVTHEQVCNLLLKESIKFLGFSAYHLNLKHLTKEEEGLSEGKTILGSYFWLIACSMKYLVLTNEEEVFMNSVLDEIMGRSIDLHAAIIHTCATADYVLDEFEFIIARNMFLLFGSRGYFDADTDEPTYENEEVRQKELLRLWHRHRTLKRNKIAAKKKFAKAHRWNCNSKAPPESEKVRILGRFRGDEHYFHPLEQFHRYPLFLIVKICMQRLLKIATNAYYYIHKVYKTLIGRKRRLRLFNLEGKQYDTPPAANIFEAAIQLGESLRNQKQFPNSFLTKNEGDQLRNVGYVLLDKSELIRDKLVELKELGRESKYIHHVCYEYIRRYQGWNMPKYNDFVPQTEAERFEMMRHNRRYRAWQREPKPSYRHLRELFRTSVYPILLETIPIRINDLELKTEFYNEKDETDSKETK